MDISIYFFTLITIINSVQCAKILGIFPSTGYSQFILCKKLMTELAHRGHHVTVISAYKPKEEVNNYTTILTDDLIKETQVLGDLFSLEDTNVLINNIVFHNFGYLLTEYILSHQEVHRLIHSNETFDLVIVETFANEAHMGFAQHFNAPLVLFSSIGLAELNSHLVGNIMLPSVEPVSFSSFTNHMTFFQRLSNSAFYLFDIIYKELVAFPRQQTFLNKYFPKKMSLTEIMYNASLMLLNSHVSTTHPTFLTTSVIEIGGFHISPKKLPRDLQKFLDEAEYGVILFSMGSNLKSSNIPQDTLNNILKVFSKLKQRVLWKFEDTDIPNKPKNLLISKWLPQSDILGHPKTVAFITHSGFLSTTEAVFYGVPMVGVPIYGDQKMNVARAVEKGIGIHLPFKELSTKLHESLKEILENPKYKENAKRNSKVLQDQVVNPVDLAIYWLEYVIRHGGAPHIKNSSLKLHWFQLYLVDVISFVILFIIIFYYYFKLLLRNIYRMIQKNVKGKVTATKHVKQKTT